MSYVTSCFNLILHTMHCYHISSKQHVICKLCLDDERSHQRSIPGYALLTLVNILMNYEIFLSHVTTAKWQRILNTGRGCDNASNQNRNQNLHNLNHIFASKILLRYNQNPQITTSTLQPNISYAKYKTLT